jgi:hypothetical protein
MSLLAVSPDACLVAARHVGDIACMHAELPDFVINVFGQQAETRSDLRDPFGIAYNVALVLLEGPTADTSLDWLKSSVAVTPDHQRTAQVEAIMVAADHLSQRTGRSSPVERLRHELTIT